MFSLLLVVVTFSIALQIKEGETLQAPRWTPLHHKLGDLPIGAPTVKEYLVPSNLVPDSAKEILLHVYVASGNSHNRPNRFDYEIFTKGYINRKYVKYFSIQRYTQAAWSSNSENIWLPYTYQHKVYVQLKKAHATTKPGNIYGTVYLVGYRE